MACAIRPYPLTEEVHTVLPDLSLANALTLAHGVSANPLMKPGTPLYGSLLFTTLSLTDHTTYPPEYLDLFLNEALRNLVRIAINSNGR